MIFPRVRSLIALAIGQCQWAIEAHERQQALLPWQPVVIELGEICSSAV